MKSFKLHWYVYESIVNIVTRQDYKLIIKTLSQNNWFNSGQNLNNLIDIFVTINNSKNVKNDLLLFHYDKKDLFYS